MANPKKKRRRKANGGPTDTPSVPLHPALANEFDVMAFGDGDAAPFDPIKALAGSIMIPLPDGSVDIDFDPKPPAKDTKFDDNLAEHLDSAELARIGDLLLPAIDQDEHDRSEWLQTRADGLDLTGQKIERPSTGNVGTSSTAVAGQSTVRDPVLGAAIDRFQANAFSELCPSEGPCKVVNYGDETTESDDLAEQLEKDFNFYLTTIAKEYYPDTRKMLWWTGFASGMFKKVYWCPLRRRPVSESVDGADLIVPSNITDLHNAGRITHRIDMRHATMRRMQILGVYRDVLLTQPTPQPNVLQTKIGDTVGLNPKPTRQEDQEYTVYECYCELDISGFEHKKAGEETGLPLPYRVTLDKDSRTILEIRRNWREDDEDFQAKIPFVPFLYGTGVGFYGAGLLQKLGNLTMACTAMMRELIDAGMFASFPGFLYAKPLGRQLQNEFRVAPGSGAPIDVSAVNGNINNAIMPLPYQPPSPALVQLWTQVREAAAEYGGLAESPVGEGKQDAPVGTTLALIEQATKIEGSVHKALHAAQAEELQLLKELFRDDPESLWRGNRRPAMGKDMPARLEKFKAALESCEIVPASDPNVPSHMHRLAKASSLLQMAAAYQQAFNIPAVLARAADMMKIDDFQAMLAPPQPPPPPDPLAVGALQLKQQEVQNTGLKTILDAHGAHAERQSRETQKAMDIAARLATHPESQPVVNNEMSVLTPFLTPTGQLDTGVQPTPQGPGPNGPQRPPTLSGMAGGPPVAPPPPMARGGDVEPGLGDPHQGAQDAGQEPSASGVPKITPEGQDAMDGIELALRLIDQMGYGGRIRPQPQHPHPARWWDPEPGTMH